MFCRLYGHVGTSNNETTPSLFLHLVYMWVMLWVSKSSGSNTGFLRHVLVNQAHLCPLVSDSSCCKWSRTGRSKDCAVCVCVCDSVSWEKHGSYPQGFRHSGVWTYGTSSLWVEESYLHGFSPWAGAAFPVPLPAVIYNTTLHWLSTHCVHSHYFI